MAYGWIASALAHNVGDPSIILLETADTSGGGAGHVVLCRNANTPASATDLPANTGSGVVALAIATVEPSANSPTLSLLWEGPSDALKHRSPNGTVQEIAACGGGNIYSHKQKFLRRVGYDRLSSCGTPVTLVSFAIPTGSVASVRMRFTARNIANGAPSYNEVSGLFSNVSGTAAYVASQTDMSSTPDGFGSFAVFGPSVLCQGESFGNTIDATISIDADIT